MLPRIQREISLAIGMVIWNLQAERQELHHPAFINIHESAVLGRKDQWRRMPEIYEPEITMKMHLAVQRRRISCAFSFSLLPRALRAVTDSASRRFSLSNKSGVVLPW